MNLYQFVGFALSTMAVLLFAILIIFVAIVAGPTPL